MIHNLLIAVGVVFLFGAAIFVHEFGHFWMARRCGMKVEAFAIGFGPKIFGWTRDGIEYSIRWIPAGGFVKLPQMVTGPMEGETKSTDIAPAPPLSKILVSAAGPFMNVVFAFALATLIYYIGLPVLVNPSIIGFVNPDSAEAKMGIREGDRIVGISGKPVNSWEQVYLTTVLAITNVLPVEIERAGKTNTYLLRADISPLVGLKIFNLDPMDHLIIKGLTEGSPGEAAHLQIGDEIIGFAGAPVSSFEQLTNLIQKRGGQETPIVVKRGAVKLNLSVTPAMDPVTKHSLIGVAFQLGADAYVIEHPTPWAQVSGVWDQVVGTLTALLHSHESGVRAKDLSGPVGIFGAMAAEAKTDYRRALNFLVLLNINLAILNMLPLPVLDGGHILLAVIERIRRRPMELRIVEYTTTAFAVLLISFMLYVTYYDIGRWPLFHQMFSRETQIEQSAAPVSAPPPAAPKPAP